MLARRYLAVFMLLPFTELAGFFNGDSSPRLPITKVMYATIASQDDKFSKNKRHTLFYLSAYKVVDLPGIEPGSTSELLPMHLHG